MKRTQLVTTADLAREEVDFLINEAEALRGKTTRDLEGKVVATLFFEPSTRTRLSFESATVRLGGHYISVADASTTSTKKGETLADTIGVFDKLADLIVMRQPMAGAAEEAIRYTQKPLINGGDGSNQHPSQALLDMLTIYREAGRIDGLTIAFVGDLKFGRTVHSLIYLIAQYKVKVILVSPAELRLPEPYLDLLKKSGIETVETSDLNAAMPGIDILYMTRIQKERFDREEDYLKLKGSYILTPEVVRMGKENLRILHPLPRVDEISPDVDAMPQAAYFREVENGLYMRMALLKNLCRNYYSG